MKRILILLSAVLLISGCGVGHYSYDPYYSGYPSHSGSRHGSYSTHSRMQDAALVFMSNSSHRIDVSIDNMTYRVKTVRNSSFRSDRYYRKTVENAIAVRPGRHHVTVWRRGRVILDKRINVYPGDITAIYL